MEINDKKIKKVWSLYISGKKFVMSNMKAVIIPKIAPPIEMETWYIPRIVFWISGEEKDFIATMIVGTKNPTNNPSIRLPRATINENSYKNILDIKIIIKINDVKYKELIIFGCNLL